MARRTKLDPKDAAERAARKALTRGPEQFRRALHYVPIEEPSKGSPLRADMATISGSRHQRRGVEGEISQFVDKMNNRVIERRTSWSDDGREKTDLWFLLADEPSSVEPGQLIEERYVMATKKSSTKKSASVKKEKVAKPARERKANPMELLGHNICAVLRWMGAKGWTLADARGALSKLHKDGKLKQEPSPTTMSIQTCKGRKDADSAPHLTNDEAAILRAARDAAPPAPAKKPSGGNGAAKPKAKAAAGTTTKAKATAKPKTKKAAGTKAEPVPATAF